MTQKQIRDLRTAGMMTYVMYFKDWGKNDRNLVISKIYRDFPEYTKGTPEAKTSGAMMLYASCESLRDHFEVLDFIINSRADYETKRIAKKLMNEITDFLVKNE